MPSGVQGLDRYAYVSNNPLRYNDPTGHTRAECRDEDCSVPDTPMGTGSIKTYIPKPERGGEGRYDDVPDPNPNPNPNPNSFPGSPECYPGELVCQLVANGYKDSNRKVLWEISPDYWIISGIYPACPIGFPVCGFAFSATIDKYGNFYVAGGFGVGIPVTASGGAGWFLAPDNDNEDFAEGFLQEHSFTVSGGGSQYLLGPGVGINNNYPSYSDLNHGFGREINSGWKGDVMNKEVYSLIIMLIIGIVVSAYNVYQIWFAPEEYIKKLVNSVKNWWPFADHYRKRFASKTYLWFFRIFYAIWLIIMTGLLFLSLPYMNERL